MAAGGEMASCGYDEADVPNAPPIAPGGGNAWHMGCHFAYISIMAALVYRTVSGLGQYIDASIHEACALTTESAIANYVYRGEVLRRQTGRHHAVGPTNRTQFRAKDGSYVTALISGGLNPRNVTNLAALMDSYGNGRRSGGSEISGPAVIAANTPHIIDELLRRVHRQPTGGGGLPRGTGTWLHLGVRCARRKPCWTTPICTIAASGSRWNTRNWAGRSPIRARRRSITARPGGYPGGHR